MKKILLAAIMLLFSLAAKGQTYTFECVCDTIMGANCDICNTTTLSRTFNGLLIRKNGVAHKWIDEPYYIRATSGNVLQFIEQIPNPEQINISLTQTIFSTWQGFIDSTTCFCTSGGGGGTVYYAGTGILISGDTIYNNGDLLANNEGILGVGAGGANSSLITSNTTGANGVTLSGATGITISESTSTNGGTITFTPADASATNELQTLGVATNTVTLSNSGGSFTIAGGGINSVSTTGTTITVTGTEVDGSTTNEIQNLSLSGQSLGISSGTGVTLPVVGITAGTNISVSNSSGNYTINTTGVPGGTGTTNKVAYWSNSTTLAADGEFHFDPSSNYLGVGANTPIAGVTGHFSRGGQNEILVESPTNNGFPGITWKAKNGSGTDISRTIWFRPSENGGTGMWAFGTNGAGGGTNKIAAFSGGVSIGTGYVSTNMTTANSLIVEGNTGFGTTSPSRTLHVAGTSPFIVDVQNFADDNILFQSTSTSSRGWTLKMTDWAGASPRSVLMRNQWGTLILGGTGGGGVDTKLFHVNGASVIGGGGTYQIATGPTNGLAVEGGIAVGRTTLTSGALVDVEGNIRVGTRTGTATSIAGWTAGGLSADVAIGSGLSVSGGTLSATVTPANAFIQNGNSFGATAVLGTNDANSLNVETNNTVRMVVGSAGNVTIGSTASTAAQFVVNGLGAAMKGLTILGGTGLVSPEYITMTGNGSGSTATALTANINMISGNVVTSINNTATTGTGGAVFTASTESTTTGDPYIALGVNGGSNWTAGIDNSDSDKFKIGPASLPGNTSLGLTIATDGKTGIGTSTPDYNVNIDGTLGVGLPLGTTAERPAILSDPIIRFNSTFGGFEIGNPTNGVYYRLSATATPSISGNTAQVGTGATLTLLSGSNDVTGRIQIDTGTGTLTAGSSAISITFAAAYNSAATPRIIITPANANAVAPGYYVSTTNHLSYQIGCVNAMANSTTYIINYEVKQ